MAETGRNRPTSMRTPMARIRGLGAAHHGVEHWYSHRLSAVANIPLVVSFVIIVASLAGRSWPEAVRIVSNPFVAILLALLMMSVTYHMRLGLQTVVEDYVHDKMLKFAAGIANTFFAVAVAAACLFAIGKISFGRMPLPPLDDGDTWPPASLRAERRNRGERPRGPCAASSASPPRNDGSGVLTWPATAR